MDFRQMETLDLSHFELISPVRQAGLLSLHQRLLPASLLVCDQFGRVIFGHVWLRALQEKGTTCQKSAVQCLEISEVNAWLLSYRLLDSFQMVALYEQLNLWLHVSGLMQIDELRRQAVLPFALQETVQSMLPDLFGSPLKDNLERDELVWQVLFRLFERDQAEWPAWSRLFTLARFSRSRQIALMDALEEIVFRDKCSLLQVVEELEAQIQPGPERAEAVWRSIYSRRYPQVSSMEETWRRQVSGLNLPDNVSVKHAPFFESEKIDMTIQVKNFEEIGPIARALEQTILS